MLEVISWAVRPSRVDSRIFFSAPPLTPPDGRACSSGVRMKKGPSL
jgi:hypothetical protein